MHLLPHLGISRVAHLPYIGEEKRGRERGSARATKREKEKPPLGSSMRTVRWSDSSSSVSIRRDYAGVFGSLVARETYA